MHCQKLLQKLLFIIWKLLSFINHSKRIQIHMKLWNRNFWTIILNTSRMYKFTRVYLSRKMFHCLEKFKKWNGSNNDSYEITFIGTFRSIDNQLINISIGNFRFQLINKALASQINYRQNKHWTFLFIRFFCSFIYSSQRIVCLKAQCRHMEHVW